jgi:hypothetical protein
MLAGSNPSVRRVPTGCDTVAASWFLRALSGRIVAWREASAACVGRPAHLHQVTYPKLLPGPEQASPAVLPGPSHTWLALLPDGLQPMSALEPGDQQSYPAVLPAGLHSVASPLPGVVQSPAAAVLLPMRRARGPS